MVTCCSFSSQIPLLQRPFSSFLRDVLKKMQPSSLSALREASLPIDIFLMREARKKNQRAKKARLIFAENGVQIYKDVEALASTSFICLPNVEDSECIENAIDYWEDHISNISAGTAISLFAGSEISSATAENLQCAEETIILMDHFDIGIADLAMVACSSKAMSQMLSHFKPTSFSVECCDFKGDGEIVEDIIVDQINLDLDEIRVVSDNEYPVAIVEAYLKSFRKSEYGLRRLVVQFPENKLPNDPFLGMEKHLVNSFQQSFSLLIRSDRNQLSQHILLRGDLENGTMILDFTRINSLDELLFKLFGAFYKVCPDMPILGISLYSPSELQRFFESQW